MLITIDKIYFERNEYLDNLSRKLLRDIVGYGEIDPLIQDDYIYNPGWEKNISTNTNEFYAKVYKELDSYEYLEKNTIENNTEDLEK